jgi:membrane fusion protein
MYSGLFRQEALMASAGSRFGNAMFYQPLTVRVMVMAVAFVFVGFIAFAAFAEVKQTELVRGYLTSTVGETKIYASRTGIFRDIHVSEGQLVSEGSILATIVDTQFDSVGNQSSLILLNHLDQQVAQLEQRMRLLKERTLFNQEQLQNRIAGYAEELRLLKEEHDVGLQRLALGEQEFGSSQILFDRGTISTRELNQVKSAWYNLLQMTKSAELNVQSKLLALEDARQQLEVLPIVQEDELLLITSNISQLQARRDEVQTQGLFSITAPGNGVVTNLISQVGNHVDPRMPVLTLVPQNYHLEARLYLPSRSLGKVEVGQEIMLSYDAYPYQTYGTFQAQIISIADAVLDPREFLFPLELGEPVYLVVAHISTQSIRAGIERRLRPGMQFSAEIITGSESILDRMLYPLTSLGRKL